jgi:hypothetical protein
MWISTRSALFRPSLDIALANVSRKWRAREIRLRYLPKPALNRRIAEGADRAPAVIAKIRADIPSGELTLHNIEGFADQPIARGVGDTAAEAMKTMWPLTWTLKKMITSVMTSLRQRTSQ